MSFAAETVVFAENLGMCGGVKAADLLLEDVTARAFEAGIPVFGYHAIVHNQDVTRKHQDAKVQFVDYVEDIPDYSAVVISAHGASPQVFSSLGEKSCEVFDATCPLVTRTHNDAREARAAGERVLYICKGKPDDPKVKQLHDEVAGMVGHLDFELNEDGDAVYEPVDRTYFELTDSLDALRADQLSPDGKYRIIWQTTLHAEQAGLYRKRLEQAIRAEQPHAVFGDIPANYVCTAVQVRQEGVRKLVDLGMPIVVVTDPTSKNGMGYFHQAEAGLEGSGYQAHAVANAEEARKLGLTGRIAMTASASTPDEALQEVARVYDPAIEIPETDRKFTLPDSKAESLERKMATLMGLRLELENTDA